MESVDFSRRTLRLKNVSPWRSNIIVVFWSEQREGETKPEWDYCSQGVKAECHYSSHILSAKNRSVKVKIWRGKSRRRIKRTKPGNRAHELFHFGTTSHAAPDCVTNSNNERFYGKKREEGRKITIWFSFLMSICQILDAKKEKCVVEFSHFFSFWEKLTLCHRRNL